MFYQLMIEKKYMSAWKKYMQFMKSAVSTKTYY